MIDPALKPYLKASLGVHGAGLLTALFLARGLSAPAQTVYRIDFIGSSDMILNRDPAPTSPAPKTSAPLPAPSLAPQKDPDAVSLGRPSFAQRESVMRPSVLPPVEKTPPKGASSAQPASAPAAVGTGEGGASVSADMPDFPYPWYLQRLRASVWNLWSSAMPSGPAECGVVFTVMKDGSLVDLKVEYSSGDSAYDLAALSTVKRAGPFPPLPPQFKDKFLKVHVQFKS